MPDSPARETRRPTYHSETFRKTSASSNQQNWILGMQGLDPQCTETGYPRDKATGPSIPDEDQGLRGSQDFVGFRTLWEFRTTREPGHHGIQDFAGLRTSWDLGLSRK